MKEKGGFLGIATECEGESSSQYFRGVSILSYSVWLMTYALRRQCSNYANFYPLFLKPSFHKIYQQFILSHGQMHEERPRQ